MSNWTGEFLESQYPLKKFWGQGFFPRGGFEGSVYCYEGDELYLHDGIVGAEVSWCQSPLRSASVR